MMLAGPVMGQVYVGPTSGTWSNATLWDTGLVPDASDDVLIDARAQISTVSLDVNATVRSLQIAIGDTLEFNNGIDMVVGSASSLDNNGSIQLSPFSLTSVLEVQGFGIQGTGEIFLSNGFARLVGQGVMLHGTAHTIRGGGRLLNNTAGMNNLGTIIADQNAAMVIDPSVDGFVQSDTATLEATGLGGLTFNTGVYTLGQSTVRVASGSNLTFGQVGVEVIGGRFLTEGSGELRTETQSVLDGVRFEAGSLVDHRNADTVTVRNGLVNDGTWDFDAFSLNTVLLFEGSQSLSGTGEVLLGSATFAKIQSDGSVLTHESGHTIRGGGRLLDNTGGIINHGSILADSAQVLLIDPDGNGFVNQPGATIEATGAGGLRLGDGTYDLNGTTVSVGNGSRLQLSAGVELVDGVVSSTGTGFIEVDNNTVFDGMTVAAGTVVTQPNGDDVDVKNGLVNDGAWTLAAFSLPTELRFMGAQTVSGAGEIVLQSPTFAQVLTDGTVLTQAAGHTIRGAGRLLNNTGGMVNLGTIDADGTATLTIDPDGLGFVNQGVLRATGSGGLVLEAGDHTLTGTTLDVADGSKVEVRNSARVVDLELVAAGSGQMTVQNLSELVRPEIVSGTVIQPNNVDVVVVDGLVNDGVWRLDGFSLDTDLILSGTASITGTGEIVFSSSSFNEIRSLANVVVTHGAGHTIRGAGSLLSNTAGMSNVGTILAQASTALIVDPSDLGFDNFGVLRAEGIGGLRFLAGDFRLNGTTIDVLDGSRLVLANGARVVNGQLSTAGSGVVIGETGSVLEAVTLTAGTAFQQANNTTVTVVDGLVNDGVWHVGGFSINTNVSFEGAITTLGGTGEMVLTNVSLNRLLATGQVLTHGADHTIRGAGNLLANGGGMVNQGTILAQGTAALLIDPNELGFSNLGTLRAEGGGGLDFGEGVFTLNGTSVEVAAGSRLDLLTGAVVEDGVLETDGSGLVNFFSGSRLSGMTLAEDSQAGFGNGVSLFVDGGLTNDGALAVGGFSVPTRVVFDGGAQTLGGTGEFVMTNVSVNQLLSNDGVLTHGVDHTIRGAGNLLVNAGGMINEGTILAQGTVALTIDPDGNGFSNLGVLRAEGSGGLTLGDGRFELNGTTVEVADGSRLSLLNGSVVADGVIETDGSGTIVFGSGSTLESMSLAASTQGGLANGVTVTVVDRLDNDGTVNVNGFSVTTRVQFTGATTELVGTGEFVLNNVTVNSIIASGAVLVQGANHTIRGAGNLLGNVGGMTNFGTIVAEGSQALVLDPDGLSFSNFGTVDAKGTGGLRLGDGLFDLNGTSIRVFDGSVLRTSTGTTITDGRLINFGSSQIDFGSGTVLDGVELGDGSFAQMTNAEVVTVRNGLENKGELFVNAFSVVTPLVFDGTQAITGNGEIRSSNNGLNRLRVTAGSVITNGVGHTLRMTGNLLENQGGLINEGTILVGGSTGLTIDPDANGLVNTVTSRVGGIGTLTLTDGLLDTAGVIDPGYSDDARGTLRVVGDVAMASTSVLELALGEEGVSNQTDLLDVDGTLAVDGVLDLTFVGGFAGTVSDPHRIVTADLITGGFTDVVSSGNSIAGFVTVIQTATTIDVALDALVGDANLDGTVDLIDLSILASNFGEAGPFTFTDADFNFDQSVDLIDLSLLAGNFGATAAVPEPAMAGVMALAGLGMVRRRSA